MGESLRPGVVKDFIMFKLLMTAGANIGTIQRALQEQFPGRFKTLTMIHRHLQDLETSDLVFSESKTETIYYATERCRKMFIEKLLAQGEYIKEKRRKQYPVLVALDEFLKARNDFIEKGERFKEDVERLRDETSQASS